MFKDVIDYAKKLRNAEASGDGPTIRAYQRHLRIAIGTLGAGERWPLAAHLEAVREALIRRFDGGGSGAVIAFVSGHDDGVASRVPGEFAESYLDGYRHGHAWREKGGR